METQTNLDQRAADPGDVQDTRIQQPRGSYSTIEPLPGEAGIPDVALERGSRYSRKGLVAIAVFVVSLITVAVLSVQRLTAGKGRHDEASDARNANRPAAAMTAPRRLELPGLPAPSIPGGSGSSFSQGASGPQVTAAAGTPQIPAIQTEGGGDPSTSGTGPIAVRPTGAGAPSQAGPKPMAPEDAPVMLVSMRPVASGSAQRFEPVALASAVSEPNVAGTADPATATRRNLDAYQRQLNGLLDTLTRTTALATRDSGSQGAAPTSAGMPSTLAGLPTLQGLPSALGSIRPPSNEAPSSTTQGAGNAGPGLFGGQLQGSATPRVMAGLLGNRSLVLPKGTAFTCALKTKVISATSGLVGCQVQRNVYSDDGRVLLVERGSHLDGEYRTTSLKPGSVRIPVLWTRIRTPEGVTVDIDSPGTGPLGESGIEGYVDNRWGERIGAALLLSLIDDSVKLVIQAQSDTPQGSASTIVLPSTTANASKLAEKVLDSTINIPPLIYQNQGGIVGIYVARDVDFSGVYELQPTVLATGGAAPTTAESGAPSGLRRRQP
jgi:type IV secretion system protein VirB10